MSPAADQQKSLWRAACLRCGVILVWHRKPGQPYRIDAGRARCPNCHGPLDQRMGRLRNEVRVRRDQIGLG